MYQASAIVAVMRNEETNNAFQLWSRRRYANSAATASTRMSIGKPPSKLCSSISFFATKNGRYNVRRRIAEVRNLYGGLDIAG
jgi:hypothetical protein